MATPELKSSHDWASTASAHVVIACGVSPPPSTPSTALHQSRSRALHVATSPHSVCNEYIEQAASLSQYDAASRSHASSTVIVPPSGPPPPPDFPEQATAKQSAVKPSHLIVRSSVLGRLARRTRVDRYFA